MSLYRQQVIDQLAIDIDLFLQQARVGSQPLSDLDRAILYQSLLGHSRKQIAAHLGLSPEQVRDRLSDYIYPAIDQVIPTEPGDKSGNWVKTLNFLLNPQHGYRLHPAPPLNSDNFQASFGRQLFLYPANQRIGQSQIEATQFYQQGLYYSAWQCFLDAWQQEQAMYQNGNPEVLIYLNNSLVEYQQACLQDKHIPIYTLAVVVPFHHNQGRIAAEILRGIAQIQTQVNFTSLQRLAGWQELQLHPLAIDQWVALSPIGCPIALRVLVVNDPNNVYDPFNQTAEKLSTLAAQLNIIAVIGHYSSEMTHKALQFYGKQGIPVINASSTANSLSELSKGEQLSFFRLSTPDQISAARLVEYLVSAQKTQQRVAIIYNRNSVYSHSYRTAVKQHLDRYPDQFVLVAECGDLGEQFEYMQPHLRHIQSISIDILILIPDGGIDPNSLHNTGLISRLNSPHCLIAGSATFYQDTLLHWMQSCDPSIRQDHPDLINQPIVACVPWHWHSAQNGCQSPNPVAQTFCQIGNLLWGAENLTWRSATAFDAVFVILRTLEQYACPNSQALLIHLHQYWKEQHKSMQGVTGKIQFQSNGDRADPPTEILTVRRSGAAENHLAQWRWMPVV
jgi:ABC-type branched-subunit amino acid transport system substrate-binding protein